MVLSNSNITVTDEMIADGYIHLSEYSITVHAIVKDNSVIAIAVTENMPENGSFQFDSGIIVSGDELLILFYEHKNLIDYNDFIGRVNLDTSRQETRKHLLSFIEETQEYILKSAFGVDYDINDYVGNSDVKRMLLLFTYCEFVTDQVSENTPQGNVLNYKESILNFDKSKVIRNWNMAVGIFNEIKTTKCIIPLENIFGL